MHKWLKSSILCGTALPVVLLWAQSANAQQVQTPAGQQSDDDETTGQDIIVTGTRLKRDGYEEPTPVIVSTTDELVRSAPTNIADGLNKLPQFFGSRNNNGVTGSGSLSGLAPTSGNYLNLRNVGLNRVLILMDGIRVPPTSVEGIVDTNTIPQALVQRVEVVTGGVSAVYGADAVSGVVNFVLDKKFEGIKGTVHYGQTEYGDARNYKVSVAAGASFAEGRGHIMGSFEHYKNTGVQSFRDRPYLFPDNFNNLYFLAGTGTAADPYRNIQANVKNVSVTAGGLITSVLNAAGTNNPAGAALLNTNFLSASTFAPLQLGAPTGTSNVRIGGDGVTGSPDTSIAPSLRTDQAFIYGSYEFSDNITGFVRASYAESETVSNTANDNRAGPGALRIFTGNPYIPAALQAQMTATGTDSFRLSRFMLDVPVGRLKFSNTSYTIATGLDGKLSALGTEWNWNAYYSHGEARLRMNQTTPENTKFYAAIDAVRDPATGNIVCRTTLTSPGLLPGCVPINLIGPGSVSADALRYITSVSQYRTVNRLNEVGFNIGGSPFSTWAGSVAINVGGDIRWQSLKQTSNSDPAVPVDYTGIRGVATTQRFAFTNVGVANGSYQVKELYGEAAVPLADDAPFAKHLELNGAVRYTDYSTFGSKVTWKAGISWEPYDDLRLRATRSRDIRAPSLFEAFAGRQVTLVTFSDTGRTNLTGQTLQISGGNPNLKPEKADTITIGAVFKPSWLPGFTGSIDYYDIKIGEAITTIAAATSRDVCVNSNGTDPLCANIIRPGPFSDTSAANFPTSILTFPVNYGTLNVRGVDVDLSYRRGPWTLGANIAYLAKYEQNPGGGLPVRELAGTAGAPNSALADSFSKWRSLVSVAYDAHGLGIFVAARTIGSAKRDTPRNTRLVYLDNKIKAQTYFDATVSYDFEIGGGNYSAFLTVNNLLDRKAPIIPTTTIPGVIMQTMAGTYDVLGRRYTGGVRFKF
jgi:iron complex outermembrane receptor protein